MLISLNWIKKYVDINVSNEELIKLIGARLVEVEEVIDETHKYDGIFAVKIVECEKIPDTHLSRCLIDDGGKAKDVERDAKGYIQVMCGAPNVHEGMLAAWIAPGAIVPSTFRDAEPFEIGMRKMLKKYDSYGMLAGADELAIGDDHTGIVELDPATTKPGDDFAQLFDLNDIILDIENKSLTHRPDTFGILGFAREVAGILGQPFKTDDWYFRDTADFAIDKSIKLDIKTDEKLCPRYTAVILSSETESSPKYLTLQDTLLTRSGMRPIDPIVDLTNNLMLLSGQPLHAFDYDKFVKVGGSKNPKIIVRAAKQGEKLTLLDGKEIELNSDDIVITSNNIPVALAGAMGGANTEIDANTKRVILESATFSLYNLRKTQMAHGIFSEAITRFTKGQPAGQTLPVALRFAEQVQALGYQPLAVFDSQKTAPTAEKVELKMSQLNGLLGADFDTKTVQKILQNVEFDVEVKGDKVVTKVPFWRTDIHISEDIIEEVGRLTGYDNIAPNLPLHATSDPNEMFVLKTALREHLSARGANEVLTYSFVHGDLIKKVGENPDNSYRIVNSISPDLQYIRQSIVPSLLDKSYANLRAGHEKFALFEMNQVYPRTNGMDEDGVPQNSHKLGFIVVDRSGKSDYYLAKKYIQSVLDRYGVAYKISPFVEAKDKTNAYYESKRSATVETKDGQLIGYVGEIKQRVLREFKLPAPTAAFEIDLSVLLQLQGASAKDFSFSQFPSVARDLTLTLPIDYPAGEIEAKIRETLTKRHLINRVICTSIYQADGADTKNASFHLDFARTDKTLEKAEIQAIMKTLEKIK